MCSEFTLLEKKSAKHKCAASENQHSSSTRDTYEDLSLLNCSPKSWESSPELHQPHFIKRQW